MKLGDIDGFSGLQWDLMDIFHGILSSDYGGSFLQ
jgi:hypothetical protein